MVTDEERAFAIHETHKHIAAVDGFLQKFRAILHERGRVHDQSKLENPELDTVAEYVPKLKTVTYGSEEYKGFLKGMAPALAHHYAHNRHHPEFHPNGITGMNLVDLVEMVCDWLAAVQRHDDGDIHRSIEQNEDRFAYSSQIKQILHNTACMLLGERAGDSDTRAYSVECFVDGMRLMPDRLTGQEAEKCHMALVELAGSLRCKYRLVYDNDE